MSKIYVYSTLTSDQSYGTTDGVVTINGGANVSNKHLLTPRGVATEIDASQRDALQEHAVFAAHQKNGFVSISEKKRDADSVADGMTGADKSAQETEKTMGRKPGRAPLRAD